MDLYKIISDLEKVDPEVYGRFDSRRRVFKHLTGAGKALTAAALPGMVTSLFNKAYGQGSALPADVIAVLNLALSLEYLEFYFYDSGLKAPGLVSAADQPAITKIRNDEEGHIKVLRGALGSAAIADPTRAAFDYSGGKGSGAGPFATVFTDPAIFYGVAQSFVDTGIRAYKGGAPTLINNKDVLEAALNIHSVEARHCSHIRTIRRGKVAGVEGQPAAQAMVTDLNKGPKSWISGTDNGGPSPNTTPSTAAVYGPGNPASSSDPMALVFPAEDNVKQATRTITTDSGLSALQASEAFDEPLDPTTVKSIARNFVNNVTTTLFT
jgi:hypothetical protein